MLGKNKGKVHTEKARKNMSDGHKGQIPWNKDLKCKKMTELEQKRHKRKKHTAEEFTDPILVSEMLNKLPNEVWDDPSKTFFDPSGGNGAFLIEILKRKLAHGHNPLKALSTLFSVELQFDNVEEMKDRLLVLIPPELRKKAIPIIDHNIVCADALKFDYENWRSLNSDKATSLF